MYWAIANGSLYKQVVSKWRSCTGCVGYSNTCICDKLIAVTHTCPLDRIWVKAFPMMKRIRHPKI